MTVVLNSDSFFIITTLLTSFAEAYNDGTYGNGSYNEPATTSTDSPSPRTSTATVQPSEQTTSPDDQPTTVTVEQPPTTTTQPTNTPSALETESPTLTGTDPMWVVIASVVAFSALISLIVIAVKKLRR